MTCDIHGRATRCLSRSSFPVLQRGKSRRTPPGPQRSHWWLFLEEVFLGLGVRTPGSFEADLVLSSVKKNSIFSSGLCRKAAFGAVHTSLFWKGQH